MTIVIFNYVYYIYNKKRNQINNYYYIKKKKFFYLKIEQNIFIKDFIWKFNL